jgi:copper chaperone CopZ
VSVEIKKLDGVESVDVSLEQGTAEVKLRDGNKVTIEQVRDVIRKSGYTPKQAQVTAAGRVVQQGGVLGLLVTGPDVVYRLDGDTSKIRGMVGQSVVVSGEVPETAGKNAPRVLVVRGVSKPG